MFLKKTLSLALLFLTLIFLFPKNTLAADTLTTGETVITKIEEAVVYFFTYKTENKVQVLENNAEKRLVWAQNYIEGGDEEKAQNMVQSYLNIKEKQNDLLGKVDGEVLGIVAERTIEQQKTMEQIKTQVGDNLKQEVVQVQERVVNQVAERIIVVNGSEGQTEFFQKVEHVWAPGTGPGGGESGVVYEGGGKLIFAPGTSAGGVGVSDIKTVEVKTGGAANNVVENGNGGLAPGTTAGGGGGSTGGNTIDPGSIDEPVSDGETWLAP